MSAVAPIPAHLVSPEALKGTGVVVETSDGTARAKLRHADGRRGVGVLRSRHGDVEVALAELTVDDTTRTGHQTVLRDLAYKLGWVVPPSSPPQFRRIPVGNAWILSVGDRQQVWSAGTEARPGVAGLLGCGDDVPGRVRAARAIWWAVTAKRPT